MSKEARKRLEIAMHMEAHFLKETIVVPNRHAIFKISTQEIYDVHVNMEPFCTCTDFQGREKASKPFLACKHLYFIYVKILGLDGKQHIIIHQSTLNDNDLTFILSQPRQLIPVGL